MFLFLFLSPTVLASLPSFPPDTFPLLHLLDNITRLGARIENKQGEVYDEHEATDNTIDQDAKKFELIHNFEQQGGEEEVKEDGRRCINKVRVLIES